LVPTEAASESLNDFKQPPLINPGRGQDADKDWSGFRVTGEAGKEKKNILNMVALPWGESEPEQGFSFPIPKSLLKSVADECPTLAVKRYEIRMAVDAAGNPSLVEVPHDPLTNKIGEQNRQSLLNTIKMAESKAILANKMSGGAWGHVDAPDFEPKIPVQTQAELVNLTYGPEFVRDMDQMVLRKFRRKV
jgi:hypothetical protein